MCRAAVTLVILLLCQIVAAAPPPGNPEVSNDICSTWEGGNGICDDYSSLLDETVSDDWVEGVVEIRMESAESVEMTITLAIREMPRGDLDLFDLDLQGDSTLADGIPADYIRNYRSLSRTGSKSIEDMMIESIEDTVQQIIEENFPDASPSDIQPTNNINFIERGDISCSYNPDIDSIDEQNGRENNPFDPPICMRSVLSLNVDPTNIGMDPDTGDIDRMMQGLMIMGGEVISNFTTIAAPGQYLEYVMIPPSYSSVIEANPPGEIFRQGQGQQAISGAWIGLNNLEGSSLSPATSVDLVTVLGSGSNPPDWQNYAGSSLSLELFIDVSDRMNSRIDMVIGVHHLSADTLAEWGLNLETSTIKLDSVTSDGIRMFDSEMDIDTEQLLTSIPMDSLSDTFSEALGVDVLLQTPTFAPSNDSGGLMFQHNPGVTCDENLAFRYCLGTSGPMASTYPVILQASTVSSEMQISNIVSQLIQHAEGDIATMDLSIMTDEDLAAIMSVLGIEIETDLSWIQDSLPADFPNSDVRIVMRLPDWIDSTNGDPNTIVLEAPYVGTSSDELGFKGARPFDWQHAICLENGRGGLGDPTECTDNSSDLICGSNQKTCLSMDSRIEVQKIALRESSAAVEIEFSAEITLEIYRLGLIEGEDGIEIEPIPSDVLRRVIAVGDRREGGLLVGSDQKAIIPFTNGDYELEISNAGLSDLASALTEEVESSFSQIEKMSAQKIIFGANTYTTSLDIGAIPFDIEMPWVEMPLDMEPTDTNPIRLSVNVGTSSIMLALKGDEVSFSVSPAYYTAGITDRLGEMLGLEFSDKGVSVDGLILESIVPPIMEHTLWGTIRSSARVEVVLPDNVRLLRFDSELGLSQISENSGHQVLSYRTPVCPEADTWPECYREKDTVTWEVEIGYMLILGELAPYLFLLTSIVLLLVSRRIRKRNALKKNKKDAQSALEEQLLELEFAAQMGELEEKLIIEEVDDEVLEDKNFNNTDTEEEWWDH